MTNETADSAKGAKVKEYLVFRADGDFYRSAKTEAHARAICRVEGRDGRPCYWRAEERDPCVRCGQAAPWPVFWFFPARKDDERPVCSSACAAALMEVRR